MTESCSRSCVLITELLERNRVSFHKGIKISYQGVALSIAKETLVFFVEAVMALSASSLHELKMREDHFA